MGDQLLPRMLNVEDDQTFCETVAEVLQVATQKRLDVKIVLRAQRLILKSSSKRLIPARWAYCPSRSASKNCCKPSRNCSAARPNSLPPEVSVLRPALN